MLVVPYQEGAGLVRIQQLSIDGGWREVADQMRGMSWHKRYLTLSATWAPVIHRSLTARAVPAVVRAPETPEWIDVITVDALQANGYERSFGGRTFDVYTVPHRAVR